MTIPSAGNIALSIPQSTPSVGSGSGVSSGIAPAQENPGLDLSGSLFEDGGAKGGGACGPTTKVAEQAAGAAGAAAAQLQGATPGTGSSSSSGVTSVDGSSSAATSSSLTQSTPGTSQAEQAEQVAQKEKVKGGHGGGHMKAGDTDDETEEELLEEQELAAEMQPQSVTALSSMTSAAFNIAG